MMELTTMKNKTGRKGIALLIVLGMLALLMIIAIAFSTLMRQGRAGSANERHAKSARNMVYVALARALEAINEHAVDAAGNPAANPTHWVNSWVVQTFPNRPDVEYSLPSDIPRYLHNSDHTHRGEVRAPEDILVSVDKSNEQRAPFYAMIMHPAMINSLTAPFVRRIMKANAKIDINSDNKLDHTKFVEFCAPEWCPIRDTENVLDDDCSLIGRYSFIVVNTSSLLDAAATGGLTNNNNNVVARALGRTSEEIQLSADILPELRRNDAKAGENFLKARKELIQRGNTAGRPLLGRLDSLDELLRHINYYEKQHLGEFVLAPPPSADYDSLLYSFRTFSRSLPEPLPQPITVDGKTLFNKICIADKTEVETNRKAIVKVFEDYLLTTQLVNTYGVSKNVVANRMWAGLYDFVNDADYNTAAGLPKGDTDAEKYKRPTVKAMPLPYAIGVRVAASQKKLYNNPDDPAMVTDIQIWIMYQPYVYFACPFWSRETGRSLSADHNVPTMKALVKMRPQPTFGNPFANADFNYDGQTEFFTNEGSEHTVGGTGPDAGGFKMGNFPNAWYEKTVVYPIAFAPDSITIQHQIDARVDILNNSKTGVLAQRPANPDNEKDRYIPINVDITFDRTAVDVFGTPIEVPFRDEFEGDFFQDATIKNNFWIEALDPRVAWNNEASHWLPSHDPALFATISLQKYWQEFGGNSMLEPIDAFGYDQGWLMQIVSTLSTPTSSDPGGTRYVNIVQNLQENISPLQVDGVYKGKLDPWETVTRGYVKNKALDSVGELAFLQLAPYFHIQLYDPQFNEYNEQDKGFLPRQNRPWNNNARFHPVLDYFTLEKSNAPARGKINLSTTNRYFDRDNNIIAAPSLASIFANMPVSFSTKQNVGRIPITTNVQRDAQTNVVYTSCASIAVRLAEIQKEKKAFQYISDLAAPFSDINSIQDIFSRCVDNNGILAPIGNPGKWERDAIIANSAGLFTLRDQTYTILMRADSFTSGFGMEDVQKGSTLGTSYAIAEVWRDPEPMKNPTTGEIIYDDKQKPLHEIRIQNFRILE